MDVRGRVGKAHDRVGLVREQTAILSQPDVLAASAVRPALVTLRFTVRKPRRYRGSESMGH